MFILISRNVIIYRNTQFWHFFLPVILIIDSKIKNPQPFTGNDLKIVTPSPL